MSVNKSILIGNLGADPEIRTTENSKTATFSIATTTKYKEEKKTMWHRCVAFGKLAEIIEKYVKKGDSIYVEGAINYNEWTDKEGNKRLSTEIIVNFIDLQGKKNDSSPPQNVGDKDDLPY